MIIEYKTAGQPIDYSALEDHLMQVYLAGRRGKSLHWGLVEALRGVNPWSVETLDKANVKLIHHTVAKALLDPIYFTFAKIAEKAEKEMFEYSHSNPHVIRYVTRVSDSKSETITLHQVHQHYWDSLTDQMIYGEPIPRRYVGPSYFEALEFIKSMRKWYPCRPNLRSSSPYPSPTTSLSWY